MSLPAIPVYLSLGANQGDAKAQLQSAIHALKQLAHNSQLQVSSFYQSQALEVNDAQTDYLNCVVGFAYRGTAMDLLAEIQKIEASHGRTRPYWHAPRTLDIDVLFFGAAEVNHPTLTVPHPRLTERAFCLLPLLELSPQFTHPKLGHLSEFLGRVSTQSIAKIPN